VLVDRRRAVCVTLDVCDEGRDVRVLDRDDSQWRPRGCLLTDVEEPSPENAVLAGLDVRGGLLGFDLRDDVAVGDPVVDGDEPLDDHAGLHLDAEFRHADRVCHGA
jgi:hypothetical protein